MVDNVIEFCSQCKDKYNEASIIESDLCGECRKKIRDVLVRIAAETNNDTESLFFGVYKPKAS